MLKRLAAIALILISLTVQGCVQSGAGLQSYVDNIDGYTFSYPNGWVAVSVSGGADVVFRDLIEETENVSVVVSPVEGNTALTDLGGPTDVALKLLPMIVPADTRSEASLVAAGERQARDVTYYLLDFTAQLPIGDRHNLASVAVRRGKVFTLNISAPEERWSQVKPIFRQVVESFSVY